MLDFHSAILFPELALSSSPTDLESSAGVTVVLQYKNK